jgi:hypothetical protein
MMLIQQRTLPLFVLLTAALLVVERWIATSLYAVQDARVLALAVTVDIAVGIPALYYFLVVRPKRAARFTLVPVFLLSLLAARFILPASHHFYLNQIENIVPFIELAIIIYVLSQVRSIVRHYPQARRETPYLLDALETSIKRALGNSPVITALATELSLVYYTTVGWFKAAPTSSSAFSYHRKSGYAFILGFFAFMLVLETVAVHLIVQIWSDVAAWVLTILSAYTLMWLVADFHAVRLQPFTLLDGTLHLRVGLRWRVTVPLSLIAEVRRAKVADLQGDDYLNLAVFGEPRLILDLTEPVTAYGPLSIRKTASRVGLSPDEEQAFTAALRRYMVPSA